MTTIHTNDLPTDQTTTRSRWVRRIGWPVVLIALVVFGYLNLEKRDLLPGKPSVSVSADCDSVTVNVRHMPGDRVDVVAYTDNDGWAGGMNPALHHGRGSWTAFNVPAADVVHIEVTPAGQGVIARDVTAPACGRS